MIGSPPVQLKHYETVSDDVVAVHFGDLYGSGIILCSDLVLTCDHVVKHYSKGLLLLLFLLQFKVVFQSVIWNSIRISKNPSKTEQIIIHYRFICMYVHVSE